MFIMIKAVKPTLLACMHHPSRLMNNIGRVLIASLQLGMIVIILIVIDDINDDIIGPS